ncbi:helix-turn-helix transcriptional regulator [Nocardiopsis sp. MG754419]|uniref:helix-turn-helix domain-containing protein n=1 Tax=Nocardiopsis sp. MG754419 TaxID=2259865 RepID=UPI001BA7AC09|nr:helix-turn-helix transcriptional regulator [Nocardiopsis sp. MG754419]MBR8743340.1 transcriptional regulator [Nocardiopsis sp. MG754419]
MFRTELRRRRMAVGMSLEDLSRRAHYSKGYLSKVENGTKPATPDVARACDAALEAQGALSTLVTAAPTEPPHDAPTEPTTDEQEVWLMGLDPNGETGFVGLDRRTALSLGTFSLMGMSEEGPTPRGRPVTPALAGFRTQLAGLRSLGQHTAPSTVFPVAVSLTHALRRLAASASPAERAETLRLAARFAEYAGWMAQESGDDRRSLWWTDRAVSMAREGGDRNMGEYALVRRALVTMYAHDGLGTLELARHAQRDPSISARVRGLAAKREAQGHALVGDPLACERALERAGTLLSSGGGTANGPEVLGSSHVGDPVGVVRGWCLVDLGRSEKAAEVLDRECAALPANAARARARFGVRRALAHALSGEVDHACDLARTLVDDGAGIDSATVRVDLRRLHQTLTRHHGHPPVRELSPRLLSVLHGA